MTSLEETSKLKILLRKSLAVGVGLINQRFSDEGEPAYILLEANLTNPRVLDAIEELRKI